MAFWNIYYGTIHFVMPVVALVWLYRKAPARYVRWRNTLVFMLGISIVAFWLYPLMPPRLMPTHYDFVDGASRFFNFGPQVHVAMGPNGEPTRAALSAFGNLFAAMPSLHVGWSTWSVLALWPARAASLGAGAARAVPDQHPVLHRRHRQPLDSRRGRWLGGARSRIRVRGGRRANPRSGVDGAADVTAEMHLAVTPHGSRAPWERGLVLTEPRSPLGPRRVARGRACPPRSCRCRRWSPTTHVRRIRARATEHVARRVYAADGDPNEPVTVVVAHGVDALVTIVGVIVAGRIAAPVDGRDPVDRLRAVHEAAGSTLTVSDRACADAARGGCRVANRL